MTEIGEVVNSIMKESFPTIVDEHFTANMESLLDAVAEGKVNWKTVVENFYPDLKDAIDKAENELEKVTIHDEVTDEICPECGRNLVIKYGPHGKFWHVRDFLTADSLCLILKKSASIALNAVRMLYLRKQGREENTMAVLTTQSVIL